MYVSICQEIYDSSTVYHYVEFNIQWFLISIFYSWISWFLLFYWTI